MYAKATDKISDEILLQQMQGGDARSFDLLFFRYYPLLCAYAKRFVGFEDAQEIVQDVMAWLWENSAMMVVESSVKSYLFAAVRNRCVTLINRNELKQRVVEAVSLHMQNQALYETADFYVVEELAANIEAALARLPETYREAFEMNRFQGLTYAEIATRLQLSPKTVDYRIQQALKLLRIELKEYLPLLATLI